MTGDVRPGDDVVPYSDEAHLPAAWRAPRRARLAAALRRRRAAPADLRTALERLEAAQRVLADRTALRDALAFIAAHRLDAEFIAYRTAARRARITREDHQP